MGAWTGDSSAATTTTTTIAAVAAHRVVTVPVAGIPVAVGVGRHNLKCGRAEIASCDGKATKPQTNPFTLAH